MTEDMPTVDGARTEGPCRDGPTRIEGTWLVDTHTHHTCGTAEDGHYGAHEPGCGLTPVVDLRSLDGWDEMLAEQMAPTVAALEAEVARQTARADAAEAERDALQERVRRTIAAIDADVVLYRP